MPIFALKSNFPLGLPLIEEGCRTASTTKKYSSLSLQKVNPKGPPWKGEEGTLQYLEELFRGAWRFSERAERQHPWREGLGSNTKRGSGTKERRRRR
jgi:hypothetical protein